MARPDREAVETFMSITGASEGVALRKLEDHHGDLNEAINAHFSEGDRNVIQSTHVPDNDAMDIDEPIHISSARNRSSFSLLDPEFRKSFLNGDSTFTSNEPFVSHPREVREIPIEVKDGHENSGHSGHTPTIEKITGCVQKHGPEIHGAVIIDEEDIQPVSYAQALRIEERKTVSSGSASQTYRKGNDIGDFPDYNNDIEEEMIQAAIKASKMDAENIHEPEGQVQQSQPTSAVDTAEQHEALHHLGDKAGGSLIASNGRLEVGSSSLQDDLEDAEEQPLVRHRRRRRSRTAASHSAREIREVEVKASSSADQSFPEWGGISSLEHDEAVMLEAALFGGIPEGSSYRFMQNGLDRNQDLYPQREPRSPSPGLASQRLIREQQDDEFLASLQADREKELRAIEEAEALRLEEQTVKEAAIDAARQKEEELCKRLEEEQEIERQLAAKESSLPREPMVDDENAVTLLVRMPDGSRHGRRFLKSDNLQSLFDFIDVGRVVKPGSFRLVRPYPRRAFSNGESRLSLNELGLTGKQEALFLELI